MTINEFYGQVYVEKKLIKPSCFIAHLEIQAPVALFIQVMHKWMYPKVCGHETAAFCVLHLCNTRSQQGVCMSQAVTGPFITSQWAFHLLFIEKKGGI